MHKMIFGLLVVALVPITQAFASEADLKIQIEKLRQQNEAQSAQIKQIQEQTNALMVQKKREPAAEEKNSGENTFGGYGEINYNHYGSDSSRDQMDLRRFVLFFGHRFNDSWSFNSEVEWEHAVTSADDKGETEIEQAYLNYQISQSMSLKTGLFLMPFGFLNESHEPPVYYGVERNEVETRIIPSTWREGGVGFLGSTEAGLEWNVGAVTGFDVTKFDDAGKPLAAVHQELSEARARDLSYYAALNYKVPGFVVGFALFTGNSTQGNAAFKADPSKPDFSGIDGRVTLGDVHARWQQGGWDIEGLYAKGGFSEADKIDQVLKAHGATAFVPSEFYGWLVQAAYQFELSKGASIAPFARYEQYDTQSSMPSGFSADKANADKVTTVGLSFKPLAQVVFKTDFQSYHDNTDNSRFNLGLGYMF